MIDCEMIFTPSGSFGDSFVASPIARHFSKMCRHLHVPVTESLLPTVTALHSEDRNITVIDHPNQTHLECYTAQHQLIKLLGPPIYTVPGDTTFKCILWDEQWYSYYQIPFGYRYTGFHLPKNLDSSKALHDKLVINPRYILTHNQWSNRDPAPIDIHSWRESAGLDSLDQFQIIDLKSSLTRNLLDFIDLIIHAEEIHCVQSGIFCLVDSITDKTNAKLFYHDIRKNIVMRINNQWNNHRWCTINYQHQLL